MEDKFTNFEFDEKILLKNDISGINQFLLENNAKQIEKIYEFLEGQNKLLLVNGFIGTGKKSIVEHTLFYLPEKTIVLNYNCFETTILDDILLTFFDEFKKLTALEKITVPKIKTENFTQKINAYFQSINQPIVIVINSFEAILKSNKTEVLGFINHLCSFKNIKVILISRNFDFTDFSEKVKYDKVTVLALSKSIFEKYLRFENFKQIGPLSDELYKQTKGYFLYTTLAIKTMKLRKFGLIEFLDGYTKSFLSFKDFILREALSLVDPVNGHLFRFLATIRHPVSVKLLKTLQLYNEDKILFFLDNLLLTKFDEYIYLQDYYKSIAENSIPENVSIKLHKGCIDLYNTQLPLKPMERDILISRQTMRNEIEYHSMFLPKQPIFKAKDITEKAEFKEYSDEAEQIKEDIIQSKEKKDEKIKKMSFIFDDDDTGILDKIADSIKDYVINQDRLAQLEAAENSLNLTELINIAKKEENSFNYKHAISLYLKAVTKKYDDDYYTFLPTIYTNLAYNYQKLSDWYDAQKYFEMAEDFYKSTGDIEKVNEIKYNIANVLYMTFKYAEAKAILTEIEKQPTSNDLKIKVLNALANLSSDNKISYNYYKKALEIPSTDKTILSELYYKFALSNEYLGDEKTAAEYYRKCIALDSNPKLNPNLSAALSNLALLYDEIGETKTAVKYFTESLKLDETNKNLNGAYSSSLKLAEIFAVDNPEKALEYYKKALDYANYLNEPFYIISTATALGDFYSDRKEYSLALDYYEQAYNNAKNGIYTDNADKIKIRIEDIKILARKV